MSNADGEIVPIVEGDQGEGYLDIVEELGNFPEYNPMKPVTTMKMEINNPKNLNKDQLDRIEKKLNILLLHFDLAKDEILII